MAVFFFDFFGSDPFKMDQTWSNWIFTNKKMLLCKVMSNETFIFWANPHEIDTNWG